MALNKNVTVDIKDLSLDFPVYNTSSQSLKSKILIATTGGLIKENSYDKTVVVSALKDLNLKIYEGDRIGLVGHNGSGKTTLLRLISDIYFPTSGSIEVKGKVTSLIDLNLGIDPEATGRENIKIRASILGLSKHEINQTIDSIIDFADLGGFIDLPFRTYSAGMQLRLAFSVATAVKPEILVMDEWLSAGDSNFSVIANKRLKNNILKSKVLILASHSKNLIIENCNRLIALNHGEISFDGNPIEYFND